MKIVRTIIILLVCLSLASLANAQEGKKEKGARISFAEPMKDYGDIMYGDSISYVFVFTNTGTENLVIRNVVTTCSCTSREYTEGEILPGQSGEVKVKFNSGNQEKLGRQNKVITILSNAVNNPARVILACNILQK